MSEPIRNKKVDFPAAPYVHSLPDFGIDLYNVMSM
jgi:hypothetical protein